MTAPIDLAGQRFGRLLAIEPTAERLDKKVVWRCVCDCGTERRTTSASLRSGNTQSCGCIGKELPGKRALEMGSRTNKTCPQCGKNFTCKASHALKTTYCSKSCMGEAYKTRQTGAQNPNWRGGVAGDPEHKRSRQRQYRADNPDMVRQRNRTTKSLRRGAEGTHTEKDVADLRVRQGGKCVLCGDGLRDGDFHIDHIIPLSKGGNNFVGNIQLTCSQCNIRKKALLPIEFKHTALGGQREDDHMVALFRWIEANSDKFPDAKKTIHIPNGGYRTKRQAARFKQMGVQSGVPDLALMVQRRGFSGLYIELKVGRNKPTTEQYDWLNFLNNEGYKAVWCTGWEAARDILVWYLTPDS